jgi:AcrR family transcriptional regulator
MNEPARRRGRPRTFNREVALDVAVEVFWRHGYEGASIAILTDAMGVAPPTLYAAFGSKQALYAEVMKRYSIGAAGEELAGHSLDDAPYQLVARFLHTMADEFTRPGRPKGCMVATGSLRCGLDSQEAVDTAAMLRAEGFSRFIAQLEQAKCIGELPAETDSAALARFYTAVLQGMSVQAIDGADAASLHAVADTALSAWPGKTNPA